MDKFIHGLGRLFCMKSCVNKKFFGKWNENGLQLVWYVLYYTRIMRYSATNMLKNDGEAVENDFERGIY